MLKTKRLILRGFRVFDALELFNLAKNFNISYPCGFLPHKSVEDSRNIIFFPLKSVREKNNIWISFSNLEKYEKEDKNTILYFKGGKKFKIDFSYYIIDNQITRSMMLDYEMNKRRKTL